MYSRTVDPNLDVFSFGANNGVCSI